MIFLAPPVKSFDVATEHEVSKTTSRDQNDPAGRPTGIFLVPHTHMKTIFYDFLLAALHENPCGSPGAAPVTRDLDPLRSVWRAWEGLQNSIATKLPRVNEVWAEVLRHQWGGLPDSIRPLRP